MVKMLTLQALTLSTEIMERHGFLLIPAVNTCSSTVFGIQLDHSLLFLSFQFCDFFFNIMHCIFYHFEPIVMTFEESGQCRFNMYMNQCYFEYSHFSVNLFILATLYAYFPFPKKISILIQVSSIGGENFIFSSLFLDFLLDF